MVHEILSVSYLFAILVTAEAADFGVSFCKKNVIASCKVFCGSTLVRIHSKVLKNCHFYIFAILVTVPDDHLGLLCHIN